ncbi:hypothetical protein OU426_05050 [Frigidibacter sp. RF13]|uniref:hypothetical protein n=1 Tax=Frigidibacter sp. RF13 TaxID=2997340 RepID=UPI00226E4930|nr:hypothetical protein [Frigidibacter sp. RF13]MCY1126215.1 hypothetical protein [Frigidibacter sp. RF13]
MSARSIIDLSVARTEALFESLDPSPFHERDLDPKALAYIVGWAREAASDATFLLRIHMPAPEAARADAGEIGRAIRQNFTDWTTSAERDRREQFRLGRIYLVVGLTMLTLCLLARRALPGILGDSPLTQLLGEGLAILGWVSNWRPIETFLYDWWPLYRTARLYRRLALSEIQIISH